MAPSVVLPPPSPGSGGGIVVYRVTGTATSRASVTFANGAGGTSQFSSATLPWESTQRGFIGNQFIYLSAQNAEAIGCVTVEYARGSEAPRSSLSCGAYAIATISGSY